MKKIFAVLLALMLLTACACAETVNQKDEAVLNIFTWEGYIDYDTVIRPFEEETGIKINYATFSTNEEMLEKLTAVKGGDYDIVLASDYMLNAAREAGLMQKLDKSLIANYANLDMQFMGQFFDPQNEYVVPYICGSPLLIYDPSAVDVEIDGLNALWDPSLKDNVGLIDDARVTIGMVLLSMGESMNTTDEAVLAKAAEKLEAIKENVHMLAYENLHDAVLSGEVAVAYTFTPFVVLALEANPDLAIAFPEDMMGFGVDACFIPSNAPHARNANLFLDFMLRPEISATITEWQKYCSTNVPARELLGEWYTSNPVFSGIAERMGRTEIVLNLPAEDEQKFQDIWTTFKLGM